MPSEFSAPSGSRSANASAVHPLVKGDIVALEEGIAAESVKGDDGGNLSLRQRVRQHQHCGSCPAVCCSVVDDLRLTAALCHQPKRPIDTGTFKQGEPLVQGYESLFHHRENPLDLGSSPFQLFQPVSQPIKGVRCLRGEFALLFQAAQSFLDAGLPLLQSGQPLRLPGHDIGGLALRASLGDSSRFLFLQVGGLLLPQGREFPLLRCVLVRQ